jgi:transposase
MPWLYDVIKPLASELIVCNPRANKLLASGNKSDRVDADKLAQLLRGGQLKGVYHGGLSVRALKELMHNYDDLVSDTTRVMNRIKAIFRAERSVVRGRDVYHQGHRGEWLQKPDGTHGTGRSFYMRNWRV